MNTIIVKQTKPDDGRDNKTFRAYLHVASLLRPDKPLGVSASTTGNAEFGALNCASKAFLKLNPAADPDELPTRVRLRKVSHGIWHAELTT